MIRFDVADKKRQENTNVIEEACGLTKMSAFVIKGEEVICDVLS